MNFVCICVSVALADRYQNDLKMEKTQFVQLVDYYTIQSADVSAVIIRACVCNVINCSAFNCKYGNIMSTTEFVRNAQETCESIAITQGKNTPNHIAM